MILTPTARAADNLYALGKWPPNPSGTIQSLTAHKNLLIAKLYPALTVVFDSSDPAHIRRVSTLGEPDVVNVASAGDYLCAYGPSSSAFRLLDMTFPANPVEVFRLNSHLYSLTVNWPFLYAWDATYYRFSIFDFTTPSQPIITNPTVTNYNMPAQISGDILFCVERTNDYHTNLILYDISNRTNLVRLGIFATANSIDIIDEAPKVMVHGSFAYLTEHDRIEIVDFSDPETPRLVDTWFAPWRIDPTDLIPGNLSYFVDAKTDGKNTLVSVSERGNTLVDFDGKGFPRITGKLPSGYGRGFFANRGPIWFAGEFYDLIAFDLSDPANPKTLGSTKIGGASDKITLLENVAYVMQREDPVRLIDIARPELPVELPETLAAAIEIGVTGHTLCAIDNGINLRIYDASTPARPVLLSTLSWPLEYQYVPPTQDFSYLAVADNWAFVYVPLRGLVTIDLSDPSHPQEAGALPSLGIPTTLTIAAGKLFCAGFSNSIVYVSVFNLTNGFPLQSVITLPDTYFVHSIAVAGNAAYFGRYQSVSMWDISDPAHPVPKGDVPMDSFMLKIGPDGRLYSFEFRYSRVSALNISSPFSPSVETQWSNFSFGSLRDFELRGNLGYFASLNTGLMILQLSGAIPEMPTLTIASDGGTHRLRWPAQASLQLHSAPTPNGPWTYQPWATDFGKVFNEPVFPTTSANRFYQLRKIGL